MSLVAAIGAGLLTNCALRILCPQAITAKTGPTFELLNLLATLGAFLMVV